MSEALEGAIVAAREAQQNTQQTELIQALLAVQALQQQAPAVCQHHQAPAPARPSWSVGKVAAVGAAAAGAGLVLTGMFLAVALTACSVAVAAVVVKQLLTGGNR